MMAIRRLVTAVVAMTALGLGSFATAAALGAQPGSRPSTTGKVWLQVSAGESHTCGVQRDHTLWCWGSNGAAQLGLGEGVFGDKDVPTQVGTDTDWVSVAAGFDHTCGLREDQSLWCWGWNAFGQGGVNSRETVLWSPARVAGAADWVSVSAGYAHTCGLRSDGTLWCWGRNTYGELGLGDTKLRKVPTQVGADADWAQVEASFVWKAYTCAVKTGGTAWCWGQNEFGQLGQGDHQRRTTPTQVGSEGDWSAISVGAGHTCATRTDATLWCWGSNGQGQLGVGGSEDRPSPTEVGKAGWAMPNLGWEHSCAIQTDGTLWCWGSNLFGQLGLGGTHRKATPVQVQGNSRWGLVEAGGEHTCAVRKNFTLWCWGRNYTGQLGLGDHGDDADRHRPTQV